MLWACVDTGCVLGSCRQSYGLVLQGVCIQVPGTHTALEHHHDFHALSIACCCLIHETQEPVDRELVELVSLIYIVKKYTNHNSHTGRPPATFISAEVGYLEQAFSSWCRG